jgi:epoxide hydrolase
MAPRPYTIEVPDAVLDDLRERLGRTRWPEQIPTTGWDYGVDVAYLRELCEHWRDGYDWRRWEARLNELPGFRCEVDGVDLHYWHVRGVGPAPMPLMLIHGWPGSMMEFLELIGPLADPGAYGGDPADAFDVVVPALPGFGFGGVPRERGWGVPRIAAALHALMTRELGYERYAAQGGDWGSMISAKPGSTSTSSSRRRRRTRAPRTPKRSSAWATGAPRSRPTCRSRARCPTRSRSPRPTRRPDWPPGSSRSSAAGATAAATSSVPSPRTRC